MYNCLSMYVRTKKRSISPTRDFKDDVSINSPILDLCMAEFDSDDDDGDLHFNKQRRLSSLRDNDDDDGPSTVSSRFMARKREYLLRSRRTAGTDKAVDYRQEVDYKMTLVSTVLLEKGIDIGDWRLEIKNARDSLQRGVPVTPFFCHVCKVPLSGQQPMNDHKKGRQHAKNLERSGMGIPPSGPANNKTTTTVVTTTSQNQSQFRCDICDTEVSGLENFHQHLSGKKHRKLAEARGRPEQPSTSRDKVQGNGSNESKNVPVHYCDLCNVALSGEEPIKDHLSGKKHNRMLKRSMPRVSNEGMDTD